MHKMKTEYVYVTDPLCNRTALDTFTLLASVQQLFNPQCGSTNVQSYAHQTNTGIYASSNNHPPGNGVQLSPMAVSSSK